METAFRLGYAACRARLTERLAEPAPARIQLLTGPRQVGKTTLLLELAREWGEAAVYAAADTPEAMLPGFWERAWMRARGAAAASGRALLLLDEVQHVPRWAAFLKGEWDRLRRERVPLQVVASGSSALRLGAGARERLAGRFERLTLTHWSAGDLAHSFGLDPAEAVGDIVARGAYPGAVPLRLDVARWQAYVRESIVEPAIGRDLMALGAVRRPALLRQVFGAAISAPAQIVSLQKLQGRLLDRGALETIAHYLDLLEDAYLVVGLDKFTSRPLRRRTAPPKLVVLSNALLAATDPRGVPDPGADPARHGAWVENACLAHAWNAGQRVTYWRQEPHEVDGVLEGSWGSWAIEVKTGRFSPRELTGLLEFTRRFPRFRPLVLCGESGLAAAGAAGAEATTWERFLLRGPTGD